MKVIITMMNKNTPIEIIPHEQAVKQRQENESKLFKLKSVQLPQTGLKDAERALERVPVTNKMYTRLKEQVELAKKKKLQKEEQERMARKLAQIETNKTPEHDFDDFGL